MQGAPRLLRRMRQPPHGRNGDSNHAVRMDPMMTVDLPAMATRRHRHWVRRGRALDNFGDTRRDPLPPIRLERKISKSIQSWNIRLLLDSLEVGYQYVHATPAGGAGNFTPQNIVPRLDG
jgi:hypothetical protein